MINLVFNFIKDYIGIYFIQNLKLNRIYIGSSIHVNKRRDEHIKLLRSNKHFNYKLQKDWNLYGEESFIFGDILTLGINLIDSLQLHGYETFYIERLKPFYNIKKFAEGRSFYECQNKFFVLKPDKTEIYCENLNHFCAQNGLYYGNLRKCALGKIYHHRGFRCRFAHNDDYIFNSKKREKFKTRDYIIQFPDGHEELITNLSDFGRIHNLEVSGLRHVLAGKNCYSKGFRIRYASELDFKYSKKPVETSKKYLVLYNNNSIIVNNLKEFCRENEISYAAVRKQCLYLGKDYKGYKISKHDK
jgi:group I intron endonuclease